MRHHDALQMVFSVSSREQRRASRRMCRYRPRDLQRRYWLGALVALILFAALYYGFFYDARRIATFLQERCAFLPGDTVDAERDSVLAALQHLFFLVAGVVVVDDFLFALELFLDACGHCWIRRTDGNLFCPFPLKVC